MGTLKAGLCYETGTAFNERLARSKWLLKESLAKPFLQFAISQLEDTKKPVNMWQKILQKNLQGFTICNQKLNIQPKLRSS